MKVRRRWWVTGGLLLTALIVTAIAITAARIPFRSETLRRRVVSTLEERLDAKVELGALKLRLYPVVRVVGEGLVVRHKGRTDVPPLIAVDTLTVHASLTGLWGRRVSHVRLDGLVIHIPPDRNGPPTDTAEAAAPRGEPVATTTPVDAAGAESSAASYVKQVVLSELEAPDARLVILRRDPAKPARTWVLHTLRMENLGMDTAMPYETTLTNAVPPGEIDARGSFGPWQREDPGQTPIEGEFTFEKADLSYFKGIAGTLSAKGAFGGTLDRLEVNGETDTPDFTVSVGGHPVPLKTRYHAIVDATNGNTTLDPVEATFLNTPVKARGGVYEVTGVKGRVVRLDVAIENGRLEDVMRLAVNTPNPVMTGGLDLTTLLEIPPGQADVVEKLKLDGRFAIDRGKFTNTTVQTRINELSKRASAKMSEEGVPRVTSDFTGRFRLSNGALSLQPVTFDIPGALVQLDGNYGLRSGALAFDGYLFMEAKISQTVTGYKSLLLKLADPIFRKDGKTIVPLKVTGTRNDPKFGVDMGRVFKKDEAPEPPRLH